MGFRFEIGDLVVAKVLSIPGSWPSPMMILGRITDECHGGVQFHYFVRAKNLTVDPFRMSDFELERYDEPSRDPIEMLRAAKEGYVAVQNFDAAMEVKECIDAIEAGFDKTGQAKP